MKGTMISAVDLLKGIAVGAGMKVAGVEGANGGLNTNYEGKMQAAVKALCEENDDFVYICPFLKLSMPKDFKDRCRLLKIPALIRPYLHTRIELLDEIVGINNTD